MKRTHGVRSCALVALLTLVGCGAAGSMQARYDRGDMFEDESQGDSSRGSDYSPSYAASAPEEPMDYALEESAGAPMAESVDMEVAADLPPPPSPGGGFVQRLAARREARRAAEPPPAPSPQLATTPATTTPTGASGQVAEETGASGGEASTSEAPAQGEEGGGEGERQGPLLIYEAALGLAVRGELGEQLDAVSRYTVEIGGFVVSQDDTSVVVRVPAARFREALGHLEALGDVVERRVSAMDVSEQVRDLEVRLQNAINLRDRLTQLLAQATTVAESLVINHELERLNETIALMQGQLDSLEERISFSTITVRFQAVVDHSEVPSALFRLPFDWLEELGLQFLLTL